MRLLGYLFLPHHLWACVLKPGFHIIVPIAPIVSKHLPAIRTIGAIIWKSLDRLDHPNRPKRALTQLTSLNLYDDIKHN